MNQFIFCKAVLYLSNILQPEQRPIGQRLNDNVFELFAAVTLLVST